MCLAIYKPAKIDIPEQHLRNAWQTNSDGAGFAYIDKGKVVIDKGYMFLKDFLDAYSKATKQFKSSPFLVHFRIRTKGDKTGTNTHPFQINGGALIHNGSIDGTSAHFSNGPSDTALFVKEFADKLTYEFVSKNITALEGAVDNNKIVLMWADPSQRIILNEKRGEWVGDIWYSNNSYAKDYSRGRHGASVDWHNGMGLGAD